MQNDSRLEINIMGIELGLLPLNEIQAKPTSKIMKDK